MSMHIWKKAGRSDSTESADSSLQWQIIDQTQAMRAPCVM